MANTTIAVLMSVYKSEQARKLNRCLKSVWIDQTRKPDQIVLIKDGPLGDELEHVIEDWKSDLGEIIVTHQNEKNIGLTKSLNIGLQYVKSDYIARMDSDDVSLPTRFAIQEKFLNEHPEIAVLGGNTQEFDDTHECLLVRNYPKKDEIRKFIARACPLEHPAVMMRTSLFTEMGIRYDERYRNTQDLALWFDVLRAGLEIDNLDDIVLLFENDDTIYKRRSRSKAMNELKIYTRGIYSLYGLFTYRYIYPITRYAFRMMPVSFMKWVYRSDLRKKFLAKK